MLLLLLLLLRVFSFVSLELHQVDVLEGDVVVAGVDGA
jgi:hypothetical protein